MASGAPHAVGPRDVSSSASLSFLTSCTTILDQYCMQEAGTLSTAPPLPKRLPCVVTLCATTSERSEIAVRVGLRDQMLLDIEAPSEVAGVSMAVFGRLA